VAAVAIAVLFAVLVVLTAFRLRRGRRRARIALVVLTALAFVPFNGQALLVCAVLIAADVFAFRRPASDWLRSSEPARARTRM
jgi:chromate transport protein ChrA